MTGKAPIDGLRSLAMAVPDPERTARFYTEIWGLRPAGAQAGAIYLRATGTDPYVLALHRGVVPAVLRVDMTGADKGSVDALYAALIAEGIRVTVPPAMLEEPGGGYGFAFQDPEGRTLRVIAHAVRVSSSDNSDNQPRRIAHVVLNSKDVNAISAFYSRALGFGLIEPSPKMTFLRCNTDHHSVAFFRGEGVTLNHVAFLMDGPDAVLRASRRLKQSGFALAWGVGQHGVGDPVFAYFVGPDEAVIEYTADVSEQWRPASVDDDLWQQAKAPSESFKAAQGRVSCETA